MKFSLRFGIPQLWGIRNPIKIMYFLIEPVDHSDADALELIHRNQFLDAFL
jgi:hypothetical protein